MSFSVTKTELLAIVDACEKRSYAEQIDLLKEQGDNVDWLVKGLATHSNKGISNEEDALKVRRDTFGTNEKEIKQPPGLLELLCEALEDFTLRILVVAAILAIVLETSTAKAEERAKAWIEGFAILVAVFVCAMVTAVNDYQKERQFLTLNSVAD